MKRKIARLSLNRDTVYRLSGAVLQDVVGGASLRACSEVEPCRTDTRTLESNCCR